jgi:betaine reductase
MPGIRVMHYVNQFFAGIGSEDKADVTVGSIVGAVGPGKPLQQLLADSAEIVITSYCGDDYFANHVDEAVAAVAEIARQYKIDLLIAGPAFTSGRYGFACAEVCHGISAALGIDCVTAMHTENPGVETYKQYKDRRVYAFPTSEIASGIRDALTKMAAFSLKLVAKSPLGRPHEEGYIPRGFRVDTFKTQNGAQRAVQMLLDKVAGRPFVSEIPVETLEPIPVAPPIADLKRASLALVTTSGIIPPGNPDGFRGFQNIRWGKYSIAKDDSMLDHEWDVLHGGYNTEFIKKNPNWGVPLDACRLMIKEGLFSRLYGHFYCTPGARGLLSTMHRLGREIALEMEAGGVDGALLVST